MAKKDTAQPAGDAIALADGIKIAPDWLKAIAPEGFSKKGAILLNQRVKVTILHGDIPVTYTLSCYAEREPVNDTESAAVASVKAEREGNAAQREAAEQAKRERETRAAFNLGQESTMSALKNIGDLAAGARALSQLVK